MQLATLDWAIVALYVVFALGVGLWLSRRASRDVDEFFLSGRKLPWWIAGTSMVATSFASDTPLVITGWVRDHGIWQNWFWWSYAASGFLATFLFARYWRRGEVMTTAELAELRYGGKSAGTLRGFVGFYQSFVKNELILSWVLLAAMKIMEVLVGGDPLVAIVTLCLIALAYSLLAGLWGVVMTDLLQFSMAMVGAIFLAVVAWSEVGGIDGLKEAAGDAIRPETLAFLPTPGEGGPLDASFWTVPLAAVAVYLCVLWWAFENVDGGPIAVQRISACKDERHGILAFLWFNVAHFALRPWPWILVALASLAVLPRLEVSAPVAGRIVGLEERSVTLEPEGGGELVSVSLAVPGESETWKAEAVVATDDTVTTGQVLARTDSERAYPAMMARFLPIGLLGLMVASLLAAFMSTVDTHVNLASSFFVNDLYRRFMRPDANAGHYVLVARLASIGVLALGAVVAWQSKSISALFGFFASLMSGVGPVYVMRWLWWRVKASTEITAMVASGATATFLTYADLGWGSSALSPDGELSTAGRVCITVAVSLAASLVSLLVTASPDPCDLTGFYRKVRPIGWWGPVRALCPDVSVIRDGHVVLAGIVGGLSATFGVMFGLGFALLGRGEDVLPASVVAVTGTLVTLWALPRLTRKT